MLQKRAGLQVCTDGEYHRRHWFMDFVERIGGVAFEGGLTTTFRDANGPVEMKPPVVVTKQKLHRSQPLAVADFTDLKPHADKAGLLAKQAIPSPTLVHFRSGNAGVNKAAYPDIAEYYADLARVYRDSGRKVDARSAYAAAIALPPADANDERYRADAQAELSKLGK